MLAQAACEINADCGSDALCRDTRGCTVLQRILNSGNAESSDFVSGGNREISPALGQAQAQSEIQTASIVEECCSGLGPRFHGEGIRYVIHDCYCDQQRGQPG